jgi:hypothetical protein
VDLLHQHPPRPGRDRAVARAPARESGRPDQAKYDPVGALTSTGALVLLVYALVEAPDAGWGSLQTILVLAGSATFLAAFALIEARHRAPLVPLVPLRFFRSRTLVVANAVMLLNGALAFAIPFVLTLHAQQVLGHSAVKFGLGSVVLAIGVAVGAIVGQAAVLKLGFRPVAATGMALMGAGSLLLMQVSVSDSYFGDIFFGLLVVGPGIGLALRDRHGRGARRRRRARGRGSPRASATQLCRSAARSASRS